MAGRVLLQKLEGKITTNTTIAQAMNGTGGFTQESASMHFTSSGNYLGEIGESKTNPGQPQFKTWPATI